MDGSLSELPALVAGAVGIVVGVVAGVAFRLSDRERRQLPPRPEPELDDGLVRVLSVLRSAAVVLDAEDDVVRASPPAYALGVVRNDSLGHPAVRESSQYWPVSAIMPKSIWA